jgi:hypothetical protein
MPLLAAPSAALGARGAMGKQNGNFPNARAAAYLKGLRHSYDFLHLAGQRRIRRKQWK